MKLLINKARSWMHSVIHKTAVYKLYCIIQLLHNRSKQLLTSNSWSSYFMYHKIVMKWCCEIISHYSSYNPTDSTQLCDWLSWLKTTFQLTWSRMPWNVPSLLSCTKFNHVMSDIHLYGFGWTAFKSNAAPPDENHIHHIISEANKNILSHYNRQ